MDLHLGSIESDYTKEEIDRGASENVEKAACWHQTHWAYLCIEAEDPNAM